MTVKPRVLVIDDSLTVRKHIVEALEEGGGFEVVAEARDGKEGIELCQKLRPDVITCDMVMPVMSGVAATEYIMAYCPTPILIVSSSTNRGEAFKTLDALAAGAVDVLEKPDGGADDETWEVRLRDAVRIVSKVRTISHLRLRLETRLENEGIRRARAAAIPRICLIGVSTGGPGALTELLPALGRDFPVPILLVQHIDSRFEKSFSEWLKGVSPLPVQIAEDGMPLPAMGKPLLLVAPANRHVELRQGTVKLTDGPERHSCRPSVDVLFESAARELAGAAIACLLTGMGVDGAEGLLAVRRAGGVTIAQDEATSVIFGMPGAAVASGAASHVLPLGEIAPLLKRLAEGEPQ